ncbi:1-aminocyclopropane-1-carboxylate deaminase [Thermonema lapsum]|uniref:1-aminocyclopropane-1-carboxylate deaminase n=1 Tax=Thermonema lapsum TaxID=28195 RepID=A0A846MPG1_9BACT|nr:pyridoxal-phosphate dependent enzyme [Thermonema lapsum]NIK73478.1 1-aminocyclopropane-1-carboxylate deaminase [Thermonema lapsum]
MNDLSCMVSNFFEKANLQEFAQSALQPLLDDRLNSRGIRAEILRIDRLHPQISGNKWLKLKYNLLEAAQQGKRRLLTFGGAYSNHLYATAAAGKLLGFETIGIVRGERVEPLNSTLQFAQEAGMQLHFVSRSDYRQKHSPAFIEHLHRLFGDFFLVPEGGSNVYAVPGCMELLGEWSAAYDYILLPCGTGGTLAGLALAAAAHQKLIGVSVLKGGDFLFEEVKKLQVAYAGYHTQNFEIWTGYAHRGYAKTTAALLAFMEDWRRLYPSVPIEHVYSAKMLYAFFVEVEQGYFAPGSRVLLVHTGGLREKD